jgi:hypothetical protein
MEKQHPKETRRAHQTPHLQPPLLLPNPMQGEGCKLPFPASSQQLNGLNLLGDNAGAPPSGGGGDSGDRGLDIYLGYDKNSLESQCTVCDGRKTLYFFDQSTMAKAVKECPLCMGKGTLGALREPNQIEIKDITTLFGRISFTAKTPIVSDTGKRVRVVLKRLHEREGMLNDPNAYFLLAAVSTGENKDKIDLSSNFKVSVSGIYSLITGQSEENGDLILSVRGIRSHLDVFRLEIIPTYTGTIFKRIGSFFHIKRKGHRLDEEMLVIRGSDERTSSGFGFVEIEPDGGEGLKSKKIRFKIDDPWRRGGR